MINDETIKEVVLYGAIDEGVIKDLDDLEEVKKMKEPFNELQEKYKLLRKKIVINFANYKALNDETTEEYKEIIKLYEDIENIWHVLDNASSMIYEALQETQEYNFIEGFKMNKRIRENL